MRVTLLVAGHIKNTSLKQLSEYYKKLLQKGSLIVDVVVYDPKIKSMDPRHVKYEEGMFLRDMLKKYGTVWYLQEGGKGMDSLSFSKFLEKETSHTGKLTFLMSGPFGIQEDLISEYIAGKISLSSLTFPHELAQVILLEQLFRAASLQDGKSYHHV